MNTQTTAGSITADTNTLRAILAALDLHTSTDEARHVLTLARVTPTIVNLDAEQAAAGDTGTGLVWQATDSYTLIEISHRAATTLTEPAVIEPAAILAAIPKKSTGDSVLTLTDQAWQLAQPNGKLNVGPAANLNGHTWPNVDALFQNQSNTITPYAVAPDYLARLAKTAKTLSRDASIRHLSQGTRDGKPSNVTPLVFGIEAGELSVRVILMPQRMN